MPGLIFKRFLSAIPTLLVLVTAAFFLMRAVPGGPFAGERNLPPQVEQNLLAAYHLDESLGRQYLRYLVNLCKGDLGPSFQYPDYDVAELIAAGLPYSLQLGGLAFLLALALGIPAGVVAARRANTWVDASIMGVSLVGISVPNFVVAPLLVLVFAIYLDWLPAMAVEAGSGMGLRNMVLPVIALALPQIAYIARITRSSMLEVLSAGFITMARARGLSSRRVLWGHALRPALLPVVSYVGPAAAALLTGSVVVETIFGIPGIGRYFVQGAVNRDYTLVMGVVVFYGVLVIAFNLVVDIGYRLIDPRLRRA
ncbi:MAG: oligopeptide ABC transporter permease OppB [Gammaproteobacteria bacterium]|nr:oligopeptide ABC transporter permease OppB [Gammaproteobacteria bacterium]